MTRQPCGRHGRRFRPKAGCGAATLVIGMLCGPAPAGPPQAPLPTMPADFFQPGTQELMLTDGLVPSTQCTTCHAFPDDGNAEQVMDPYSTWVASMMAQAARDPVFHAAFGIAENDAPSSGETCIRCHAPLAWLAGNSDIGDVHLLMEEERDGINCNFCHRLVDPVYDAGSSPDPDVAILDGLDMLGLLPAEPGNARYVVDPLDTRRGPLDDVPLNFHTPAEILVSPFHRESDLCATCHDVSNPIFTRLPDGTFEANGYNAEHPSQDMHEMMPEQRTYSEWLNSQFAAGGVYFDDARFGGDHPTGIMESCQDCHMPKYLAGVCMFWSNDPFFARPDAAQHSFVGANTWVLKAIRTIDADGVLGPDYTDGETGLNDTNVAEQLQRVSDLLAAASDMLLAQIGDTLKVRVVNYSGHKLPTGYPEGRRMWLNVKLYDGDDYLIEERGQYDFATAVLDTAGTKVYEATLGIDTDLAEDVNLAPGESFHLVLNNEVLLDNRIPPIGFTNAAFEAVNSAPVAAAYADGQHWDDTLIALPAGTAQAVVTLYYQTSSKEYMDFLNESLGGDESNPSPLYQAWIDHGRSAPVVMDMVSLNIAAVVAGDLNGDGFVDIIDLLDLLSQWGPCPPPDLCAGDLNCDGTIDIVDLLALLANWG